MISVLTLTYKRHHILEEAIESFLKQDINYPKEMVIINDNKDAEYIFDHPDVRIINLKDRFTSISEKLKWGFNQCKYDYVYRLDDDDLLYETALISACEDIVENPGFDIYRSSGFYFFVDNKFERITSNINNGNIYTKNYIKKINWPTTSIGEDSNITFHQNGKIYESVNKKPTMIYRWGMNTFHLSGAGERSSELALQQADESLERINSAASGIIQLYPKLNGDYYEQINRNSK